MPAATPPQAGTKRIVVRLAAMALIAASAVVGCAGPSRIDAPPKPVAVRAEPRISEVRYFVDRDPAAFAAAARDAFNHEQVWRASTGQTGPLPPVSFLAISGGGHDGAFAAGLLNGWTEHGDRPEFKAVTGISTGALIAPFAFLGPRYDATLKSLYTNISSSDIYRKRFPLSALFNDALSDTEPLYRLTARYVTRQLLDEIAAEYAKGRLLLIGTTDLDSLEPVVWNMTAIAASKDPHAIELFRKVLMASAAIPGVFPPVMIDVTVDGVHYQEMHVDGGVATQVFTYPPSLNFAEHSASIGADRTRTLYIIRNARLDPDWANTKRRTLSIAGRAIASLIQTQGVGDLYRIYVTARRDNIDYNLAFIPSSFRTTATEQFDTAYMRSLYQTGYDLGVKGYPWRKTPPSYQESTVTATR